jgi:hypothetical protein
VIHLAASAVAYVARIVLVAAEAVVEQTRPVPQIVPVEWVAEFDLAD